jgi:glyoxalase family protein
MNKDISGLHHVTAIAGDAQRNVDFYVGVLGVRLVKRTVNFDDPGTYHLYYGDEAGNPGTILTFFPFPVAPAGRRGSGQATATAYSIPADAIGYWIERFKQHNIRYEEPISRFDEQVLTFYDPDGLKLELVVAPKEDTRQPWLQGPIPAEYAIRGFYSVTLMERSIENIDHLLVQTMGFRRVGELGNIHRYEVGAGGPGAILDIVHDPKALPGHVAVGTVHHIAWRTTDDASQLEWQTELRNAGMSVTPVQDRQYFHSIYYREPGGVLFEIATNPPGFAIDESPAELGLHLMLPTWLEPNRAELEQTLPPLTLPQPAQK